MRNSRKRSSVDVTARVHEEILAFGVNVKRLRSLADLTIREMAAVTGLSQSAISKIENGLIAPNYDSILRIAEGLDVDVQALFNPLSTQMSMGRRSITKSGSGRHILSGSYGYEFLCTDISKKKFIPIKARISRVEIKNIHEYSNHDGEEYIYVLSGEIILITDAYEPTILSKGDSCYFDSSMRHALIAQGEEDAEVLWIASALDESVLSQKSNMGNI